MLREAIKLLNQNSTFMQIFAAVGFTWKLDDEYILTGIEQLMRLLYGFGLRLKEVDVACVVKIKQNVWFERLPPAWSRLICQLLPPCSRVHIQHIMRVNFQV